MKVLSLLQPWASLAVMGAKRYEVRNWQTPHRGPLLIHASARHPTRREKSMFESADYFKDFIPDTGELPYGSIIGQVTLTEIFRTERLMAQMELDTRTDWERELAFDDFSPNRYAWKFEEPKFLKHFLPLKGSLGLWTYDGLL